MKEVTYYKSEGDSVQVFNLAEHDAIIRKQTLEEHKAMCDSCIHKVSKEDIDAIKADTIDDCIKVVGGNIKSYVNVVFDKNIPITDRALCRKAKNELIEDIVKQLEQLKEQDKTSKEKDLSSHSEEEILKECIKLMHELVDDFAEWYEWVHGENAIAELDEEERFCVRKSYFSIVQQLFLFHTKHSGGTSTCEKCNSLGIKDWSEDIEFGFEVEEDE